MKRREFFIGSSAIVGVGAMSSMSQLLGAPETGAAPFDAANVKPASAPVVTNMSAEGFTVLWGVSGPATGWVEYGETPEMGKRSVGERGLMPYDSYVIKARIEGLKPGTKYYYRVHTRGVNFVNAYKILPAEPILSEVGAVTTLNPKGATADFIVWNDTHEVKAVLTRLAELTRAQSADFLLWNGDQTNYMLDEREMVEQFLNPAGQTYARDLPLMYVRGNHDVRGVAARSLPRFTDTPDDLYYYSFRQGPLAALVMDTGEDKPDDHPVYGGLNDFSGFRKQQQAWLEQEIQKPHIKSAPYKVLFCHIPMCWKRPEEKGAYCVEGHDLWHDLLVKAGVQLVISGHTHDATWMPAEGKRPYGQLIGGGPKLEGATIIRGKADAKELRVQMTDLTGKELALVQIKPHKRG
ncbi:hypothetical protein EON83_06720 [bacterium]|nr:MAG: hypothetical protein EON83_06720 [bacterium]